MEHLLKRLKEIMQKQIHIMDIIRNIEKTKQTILSQGKLADFSEMNHTLSSLIEENQRIEKEREKILQELSQQNPKKESMLYFQDIVEHITDNKLKADMEHIYQELKEVVLDIKNITKINQELIETAIEVIELTTQTGLSVKNLDYTQNNNNRVQERPLIVNRLV